MVLKTTNRVFLLKTRTSKLSNISKYYLKIESKMYNIAKKGNQFKVKLRVLKFTF